MSLTKRICALFLSLLLCLSVLSVAAYAAEAPKIVYDRYDGVKTDAYVGTWSTFSVKVENYKEGDTISYKWQTTIKACEADADDDACAGEWHVSWYDIDSDMKWAKGYENSPSIQIYNTVNDAEIDDEGERFVFRCIVTLNGKEGKSPVFEQHCMAAEELTEIRINGINNPTAGASPDFSGTSNTPGIAVGAINWTYIASTGYTSPVTSADAFAYTGTYELRVCAQLSGGYTFVTEGDNRTVAYLNGSSCLVEYPEGYSDYVVLVRTFELLNGSCTYIPYLYQIDSLLAFDDTYQYPGWDAENSVNYIDVVANTDETFQFAPAQLPDGAVEAGYTVETSYKWHDGTKWNTGSGTSVTGYNGKTLTQLTVNTGSVGSVRTVIQILTLKKDGKVVEGKTLERRFLTTAKEGLPPVITRFFKNDQVKTVGDSATFYCKASGTGNQYLWMVYCWVVGRYSSGYAWAPVAFGNSSILQYDSVTKEMDGWIFKCRVTNDYGTTYSPEVTLTVNGTVAEEVSIVGVTAPSVGDTPVWTGSSVSNSTGKAISDAVCWLRADNLTAAATADCVKDFQDNVTVLEEDSRFEAGKTYYAMVNVTAADDYRYIKGKTKVTINGKNAKIIFMEKDQLCAAISFKMPGGECPTKGYADVPAETNWAHAGIDFCVEWGIMGSTKTDKLVFEPNTACTRAMIVSILYRLAGSPAVTYQPIFSDVKDGQWYTNAVVWAYNQNVVSGKPDGTFAPNDKITREQMAVTLMGYAKYVADVDTSKTMNLSGFADAAKVTWSEAYITWAVAEGVISGKTQNGKTYLDPQGKATRAEVASILMRFITNVLQA